MQVVHAHIAVHPQMYVGILENPLLLWF